MGGEGAAEEGRREWQGMDGWDVDKKNVRGWRHMRTTRRKEDNETERGGPARGKEGKGGKELVNRERWR